MAGKALRGAEATVIPALGKPFRRCIYIALLVPIVCGVCFNPVAAILTIPSLLFTTVGISLVLFFLNFYATR